MKVSWLAAGVSLSLSCPLALFFSAFGALIWRGGGEFYLFYFILFHFVLFRLGSGWLVGWLLAGWLGGIWDQDLRP